VQDPSKFTVATPVADVGSASAAASKEEEKEEEPADDESDVDLFSLFD
jgi:ribosomal protein L12E/L44/L45/RPP1/RPP2